MTPPEDAPLPRGSFWGRVIDGPIHVKSTSQGPTYIVQDSEGNGAPGAQVPAAQAQGRAALLRWHLARHQARLESHAALLQ